MEDKPFDEMTMKEMLSDFKAKNDKAFKDRFGYVNFPDFLAAFYQRHPEWLKGGKGATESKPGALKATEEAFSKPFPAPIKETRDFTEAVDDRWDGQEE
jgi:hypothetical protein